MKFLYVNLDLTDLDSTDFRRNVTDKVGGVKQLGNEADYICYNQQKILTCVKGEKQTVPFPDGSSTRERLFCNYVLDFLKEQNYDTLYLKGTFLCDAYIRIASCVKRKKFGAKVIFEPEHYPEKELFRDLLNASEKSGNMKERTAVYMKILRHKRCLAGFSQSVDTVVVFETPTETVWGVPAITVNSGLSAAPIRLRSLTEELGDPISILCAVQDPKICGIDRLLRGMSAYRSMRHHDEITVDIVGSAQSVAGLEQMADKWEVGPYVHFLGDKSENEINDLCLSHTVAFSSLGLFRAGRTYYSPYLTKLFCAAGIPFVYAYEDAGLDLKVPFALKIANVDAPVSMPLVAEFVWRCRLNPRLTQIERRFAEDNYDWRVIMKQILEFTATGKREV